MVINNLKLGESTRWNKDGDGSIEVSMDSLECKNK